MMTSSCFANQWRVGSPCKTFQWRHQRIPPWKPTPLTWSTCSIFLGNTGCRKFDHWKPTGTADEIARKKKRASAFMDYLSSTMDHAVSQRCRIYQLEDVRIRLESHQMNLLTISELLLIDAISRQKTKRNGMSSTDS